MRALAYGAGAGLGYDAAARVVAQAVARFGRIDIDINSAGYSDLGSFEDTTIDSFRTQVDTNFYGVVNVTKAVVPFLHKQGNGHIFQVSSLSVRWSAPGMTAYQAAKWAVAGFSIGLAQEIAPFGVQVTVLEPGGMRTDWAGASMETPPISEPYQATVGASARAMADFEQHANSDPRKVADLVLTVADLEDPPLRLLAGSDAYEFGREAWQHRVDTDARWAELSASTDHAESGGAWRGQRGTSLPDVRA